MGLDGQNQKLLTNCGTDAETAELVVYNIDENELQRLSCAVLGTLLGYAFFSPDEVFFHSWVLGEHDPMG